MAQRYWSGTIGGIPLIEVSGETAGFDLTGAAIFESSLTGNTVQGASGFPHTYYTVLDGGQVIEIKFLHVPASLLRDLITLFETDITVYRACTFEDGFQTITGEFKPNVPGYYSRGTPDGNYVEDATLRLIANGS